MQYNTPTHRIAQKATSQPLFRACKHTKRHLRSLNQAHPVRTKKLTLIRR